MIPVTELRSCTTFKVNREIFEVAEYRHTKMGRGTANIRVKVRNLRTGQLSDKTFVSGAKVEEAEVEKKKLQYLYQDSEYCVFMDPKTFEQLPAERSILGDQEKFLKEGESYNVLVLEDTILSVELPKLTELKVAETGPGVRGDTVANVFKPAILEDGLEIKVPLFINVGDKVRVDTRTGGYVERVK